jgi:hypothetical protein
MCERTVGVSSRGDHPTRGRLRGCVVTFWAQLIVAAAVALAAGVLAGTASAQAPATPAPGTITAVGTASIKPTPDDANSNDSIAAAVRQAKRTAIPSAVSDARNRAVLLAAAGNLKLGALLGIADVPSSPFFGGFGQDGTFGPGRFCGMVSRYRTTRSKSGAVRRKLVGRTRRCRVPDRVIATEAVTFASGA